jgi:(p)ppGpp synthase/HD superfamily hydrolase
MLPPPFAEDRPAVREAVDWAAQAHAGQRRDVDDAPFIVHPLEVASLLHGRGFDDDVVAAGVLHDVVEKTAASLDDVRARFGDRTADLVAAVTEDDSVRDFLERKHALAAQAAAAGAEARAVYAADKVSKVRELRAQAAADPSVLEQGRVRQRLQHYEASLEMLRAAGDSLPIVDQLAFELWALRVLPPR